MSASLPVPEALTFCTKTLWKIKPSLSESNLAVYLKNYKNV